MDVQSSETPALFDADAYLGEPELDDPQPEPEPDLVIEGQLGWDNIQLGRIAVAEYVARVIRLGGSCSIPDGDPGGGVRSDVTTTFPGRLFSVQVKGRTIDAKGKTQFDLGPRDGTKKAGYIGRAQFFALAVFNQDGTITDWYLIPAQRLRYRVSLTVTPGWRSHRKRKDWLEPEVYRNKWETLLDAPVDSTYTPVSRAASTYAPVSRSHTGRVQRA